MAYLLAGPFVALIGIVAVYFVLHRKSVDKRSMYSARREQIQHKVRAARQRTLAGQAHVAKAPDLAPAPSPFAQTQVQPTVTYEAPVYSPPPAAPMAPPPQRPPESPAPMPWEQPSIPPPAPAPAPSGWDVPAAPAAPAAPFTPAPEPTAVPAAPSESLWTPAPRPAEPPPPVEPVAPAASSTASATSAGSWSIVSTAKESAEVNAPVPKKKGKKDKAAPVTASSWQLASGDEPAIGADEAEVRQASGRLVAVAQYAVLVVGLVMVLIGVLVMVANSRVT
ncbi:MAG TPA: hypothetical protein VJP81_05015 [Candidatus Dormibacteraeota bacterium]|nr:hypothetical protein [Candidatus Dormibacteraeota bacterium]